VSGPSTEHPFGRFLEDFVVGACYRHWPGRTITQAEDILFCSITMNQHPLHSDDNYAAVATSHGRAMVVGNLVYSVVLGQSVPDVSGRAIANLEIESLRHPNPVFHGDTIYSETSVLEVTPSRSKPDRGIVRVRTIGYKQDGTVVCEFVRKVLVPRRGHGFDGHPGRPEPILDAQRDA
jgi:acyl dehydratase